MYGLRFPSQKYIVKLSFAILSFISNRVRLDVAAILIMLVLKIDRSS